MGRVHWIGGEKGGVGKSVVARLLAQYCIDRMIPWSGFDTDRSHGALLRYYSEYTQRLDVTEMEELDAVVDQLEAGVEEVVVDLAAQTEAPLFEWLGAGDVIALLEQLGHQSWFWYVVDDGKDSVQLLSSLLDRLGRSGNVVCVLNRGRGRDFMLFEEAKLAQRVEESGGDVIELPALHPGSMLRMDAYDKSFWAAIHNDDATRGPCLTLMQRQRANVFVRTAHANFYGLFRERAKRRGAAA
ncbi:MAG: mobilization protein [Myxococcota bacterium]